MTSKAHLFPHTQDQLKETAADILRCAAQRGASSTAVEISEGNGLSVTVRHGALDTIEHNRDQAVGVTVWIGKQRGDASTNDLSLPSIQQTVAAAVDFARHAAKDACTGLADAHLLEHTPPSLDLFHPWLIDAEAAAELARRAEQAAFDTDARIRNSEGATVCAQHGQFVLATNHGFLAGYPYSRHAVSCVPIAQQGRNMQRDSWSSSKRSAIELAAPEAIGRYAAERAAARLQPRTLSTRMCPVLFEAPLAAGLLGAFVRAVSGGALYRRISFLVDSLGERVFAPHIQIHEAPHQPRAMGAAPFDQEGVRARAREVVRNGVVQGYFLSTYSARKLGMQTTGNAGGAHQLILRSTRTRDEDDLRAMLKKLDTGLLLTEVMGQGVNYVTGDYSRGAVGFWVERGEIQYPVEGITVAGNLKQMFKNIVAVGADVYANGTKETGSVLIERMTVAG